MAEFFNTAEGGTPGVDVTTANSGGASGTAFNEIRKTGTPTITFSSTAFNGSLAYRIQSPGGTVGSLRWNMPGGTTSASSVFYVKVDVQSALMVLCNLFNASSQNMVTLAFDADRRFVLQNQGTTIGTLSTATTLGNWYRVRWQANAAGLLACQVFEGNNTTVWWSVSTGSSTMTSIGYARTGCETSAPNADLYVDDWRLITGTTDPIELPPAGPAWSVWNGTTEQPLTLDGLWNGTTIEPLTLDTVTDVEVPAFIMDETEPSAATTGIAVAGLDYSDLTVHDGNLTITTGQTITGMLIRGRVSIPNTTSNAIFENSTVVSRTPTGTYIGEGMINSAGTNITIRGVKVTQVDPTLDDQDNSVWYGNGIKLTGGSALVERCDISEVVDGIYINGGAHEIAGNYSHDFQFRDDDQNQGSGTPPNWSHNDGVQIMGGNGHNVHGNTYDMRFSSEVGMPDTVNPNPPPAEQSYRNCHGILLQGSANTITSTTIHKNWFHYGAICIQAAGNSAGNSATITENRFTPNQGQEFGVYVQMMKDSDWTLNGTATNVYSDHPDTPAEWRGEPIKAPTNGGTRWAYNQSAHTP